MFSCWDLRLAIGLGLATFVYLGWRYLCYWRETAIEAKKKAKDSLAAIPADLHQFAIQNNSIDTKAAAILLSQLQSQYSEVSAASKDSEAKANTILGFLGGGISLVAAFTGFKAEGTTSAPFTLSLAILVFIVSLFASLRCLHNERRRGLPEIQSARELLEKGTFKEGSTTAYLVYAWQARLYNVLHINTGKAHLIEITQTLFLGGTFCLAASLIYTIYRPPKIDNKQPSLTCSSADKSKAIFQSKELSCKYNGDK